METRKIGHSLLRRAWIFVPFLAGAFTSLYWGYWFVPSVFEEPQNSREPFADPNFEQKMKTPQESDSAPKALKQDQPKETRKVTLKALNLKENVNLHSEKPDLVQNWDGVFASLFQPITLDGRNVSEYVESPTYYQEDESNDDFYTFASGQHVDLFVKKLASALPTKKVLSGLLLYSLKGKDWNTKKIVDAFAENNFPAQRLCLQNSSITLLPVEKITILVDSSEESMKCVREFLVLNSKSLSPQVSYIFLSENESKLASFRNEKYWFTAQVWPKAWLETAVVNWDENIESNKNTKEENTINTRNENLATLVQAMIAPHDVSISFQIDEAKPLPLEMGNFFLLSKQSLSSLKSNNQKINSDGLKFQVSRSGSVKQRVELSGHLEVNSRVVIVSAKGSSLKVEQFK